jgi:hypothetical protein
MTMFRKLYNHFVQGILKQKITALVSWACGNRTIRGKWTDVKVWASLADADAYRAGDMSVQPIMTLPDFRNGITDVGIHYVLEVAFRDGVAPDPAQIATWYAGLIDNASFTGVAAGDTSASHAGWIENQDYDEAARVTITFAAAATRKITAAISFTINDTITCKGLFIISVNTKGGTTGTLFSTALFASAPSLVAGNVLTANYSLTD